MPVFCDPAGSTDAPSARGRRATLDLLGAAASCACACHCVALPAAAALLPVLGLHALLDERVEWALLALTIVVGVTSLGGAALRRHRSGGRRSRAPALFALGLALLLAARAGELRGHELAADLGTLLGASLVAAAHLRNRRRLRADGRATAAGACCPCPSSGRTA